MSRWLYCFFFLFFSSSGYTEEINELPYSPPDQLAALTQDIDKIGGIISPLSGQPVLKQTDLVAKGAQDVLLRRVYVSQHRDWYAGLAFLINKGLIPHQQILESGWVIFPHIVLDHIVITKRKSYHDVIIKNEVRIVDPSGAVLTFVLDPHGKTELIDKPYGICNSCSPYETPGGQFDLRNTKIVNAKNGFFVHSPNGSIYHYNHRFDNDRIDDNHRTIRHRAHYLLSKETLPNGKILRYCYNADRELKRVESMDSQEKFVYAFIDIDSSPLRSVSHFKTNSGKSASYQQQKRIQRSFPKKKHGYETDNRVLDLLAISSVNTPFYSNEQISFSDALLKQHSAQQKQYSCDYETFGERLASGQRVSKLLLPDDDAQFHSVHEIRYRPPLLGEKAGKTTVKNIDGTSVIYEYSPELLLTAIHHYDAHSSLTKQTCLDWTKDHRLSSVAVQEGNGRLFYKKSYQYDSCGNPVLEELQGELRGGHDHDKATTKRRFSDDGRHLLLEEENDNEKTVSYQYLPNTHLTTSKLTQKGHQILRREFFEYDDCHNLIKKIEDNGSSCDSKDVSGVTQRKIFTYVLRNQQPFLHMPEWLEEKFLDCGSEKLLKRTHLSYDAHGNVNAEEVYDADGVYAYTIYKTYNDRGNVMTLTNAIGQQAKYDYDEKGRQILAVDFSGRLQTKTDYDIRGNVIKIEEVGSDQIVHTTSFSYDLNDLLTQKTDSFHNVTDYQYDPICRKVAHVHSPSIVGINGKSNVVETSSTYDAFGRAITKTDANGNVTTYQYGTWASPILVVHPDGNKERRRYTKTGLLASYTNEEGLTIAYTYDVLDNVISKLFSTSEGVIATEAFVYDGINLIEEIDREGRKTCYQYDGAGRLISKLTPNKTTSFAYDSLGRLSTTTEHNGSNTLITHYQRDLLDRILEQQCTDTTGNLLSKVNYEYDPDGNVASVTRNIGGNDASETFEYDSFQRQIKAIDALGNQIQTIYNENACNGLGQQVLQIKTVDPIHRAVVEIKDPYGRLAQKNRIGADGALLASEEMIYDPNGNLTLQKNHIYRDALFQRTLETSYSYTPRNQISSFTRAFNTLNSRTTDYQYTPSGKIAKKTKSDGIAISYSYYSLGYLKTVLSSDQQLSLTYDYNQVGHLLKATDQSNHVSIERTVDTDGNVLCEIFPTGLAIEKTYDAFGRTLSVVLPNKNRIHYTYDPAFLREVSKISPEGDIEYTHGYSSYDLSGRLQKEQLLNGLGTISHFADSNGRQTSIISPFFTQNCLYDAVGNVVVNTTDHEDTLCTYNALDQLVTEASDVYQYDSNHNRIKENGLAWISNELDELLSAGNIECAYDRNGNLISKKTPTETLIFAYDPLDRLVQVIKGEDTVKMSYDPLGRRLSKTVNNRTEHYLYDGNNEIGAFTSQGIPEQLRILGLAHNRSVPSTIAVELGGEIYATVQDLQGSIRRLIPASLGNTVIYDFTAFGRLKQINENVFNPWQYASKRFDPETRLINFGKRYYDPDLSRWISADPAGFLDTMNLYAYVRNNPLRYFDPDGQFAVVIPLITIGFDMAITWITAEAVAGAVVGAIIGVTVYQVNNAVEEQQETIQDIPTSGTATEEKTEEKKKRRPEDIYVPVRPLPQTKRGGVPIPDSDTPHTQLGTAYSDKGYTYPKAREFGCNGKPVRSIDFTDHKRPHDHPYNPHVHPSKPNATGGTDERGKQIPLETWKYY